MREKGFRSGRDKAPPAAVHQAVLAGCLRGIGFRREKNIYQVAGGRTAMIFPGSSLFGRAGAWVAAAEVVETGRLYLRTVANVRPEWIEEAAAHLCRRHYHSPRWEKKGGRVAALENVSLFGLSLAANRRVDYGRVDPAAAREIFIQSALVEGELGRGFAFLDHNLALVGELREDEERLRRRGLVADDREIFALYDARLPEWVRDRATLKRFIARGRDRTLVFRREELLSGEAGTAGEEFPGHIEVDGAEYSLEYSFNPGGEDDGITVVVPAALAGSLRPDLFEWLVPGMLEDKIAAMLKTLPKAARRRLVPVPATARRIAAGLDPWREPLDAVLARVLREEFALAVTAADFSFDRVPGHLRPRYRIVDRRGRTIACGRDFAAIAGRGGRAAVPDAGCDNAAELEACRRRDIGDARELLGTPARVAVVRDGRLAGFLFPRLGFDPARNLFSLDLDNDEAAARRANRRAVPWLYAPRFAAFRKVVKGLKLDRSRWALVEGMGGADGLDESLRAFVLARVFACGAGLIPSAEEYERVCEQVAAGPFARLAAETMDAAVELLRARRGALDRIRGFAAKARRGGEEMCAAMEGELSRLVGPDFFEHADLELCRLRLRHLKALAIRAERAHADPGRDLRRQETVRPFRERIPAAAPADPEAARALAGYALMVDEFAVTVFAQELGAAMPVSPARLEEKWREVEPLLRRGRSAHDPRPELRR
jgi:ATP-dependent helicase HrpA